MSLFNRKNNLHLPMAIQNNVGPIKVDVIEKLAPTAEMTRLLRELEAEAMGNVLKSLNVCQDNEVTGKIHQMAQVSAKKRYIIHFSLNGNDHDIDFEFDENRFKKENELIRLFVETLSEEIAKELLAQNLYVVQEVIK